MPTGSKARSRPLELAGNTWVAQWLMPASGGYHRLMCASRLRNRLALIFPLAAVPGVRRVPRAIVSWCLSTSVLTAFAQAAPEAPTVATDGKTPAATRLSNTYPLGNPPIFQRAQK